MIPPDRDELTVLSDLSHAIDRLAMAFAAQRADHELAARELVGLAAGQRAALAIALSYALRTSERDPGFEPEQAVLMLRLALSAPFWGDSDRGGPPQPLR